MKLNKLTLVRVLVVLAVLVAITLTAASQTKQQIDATTANTKNGLTSQAAAAAMANMGHVITQNEMAQLVKDGKASRCAVLTDPPLAEVYVDGNRGGVAPMVFVLFRKDFPRTVTLKLAGYKTVELPFIPNGTDIPISVKLEKLRAENTTPSVTSRPVPATEKADAADVRQKSAVSSAVQTEGLATFKADSAAVDAATDDDNKMKRLTEMVEHAHASEEANQHALENLVDSITTQIDDSISSYDDPN